MTHHALSTDLTPIDRPQEVFDIAIRQLEHAGFTTQEATNLIRSLRSTNPNALIEHAPKWISWCAHVRECYETIIDLAAKGVITVQWADNPGDMLLSLNTQSEDV